MKLDKNSLGSVFLVYLLSAIVMALLIIFVKVPAVTWPLCALIIWFCVWQTMFFRVPVRKKNGSTTEVTAVADGRIVIYEKAVENEFLGKECLQISIYMNFFDVHANFWPVSGEVTYYKYHPGKHLFAFNPKSSDDNEHTSTCIHTPEGKDIFFKQIAGGFARRIVNYAKPGMKVEAGEQCGIIKFGSRIDLFLPLNEDVKVSLGDYTRACETIIVKL